LEIEDQPSPNPAHFLSFRVGALCMVLLIVVTYLLFALDAAQAQNKMVSLDVNGLKTSYQTSAKYVDDFVKEIYPDDSQIVSIFPSIDTELSSGDMVYIQAAPKAVNPTVAMNLASAIEAAKPQPEPETTTIAVEPEPEPEPIIVFEPTAEDKTYIGTASWYRFGNGLNTASTQFPRGTKIRVMAVNSGKTIDVVVNDYGPEDWTGVALDLNSVAFSKLAPLGAGKIQIKYYVV